MPFNRKLAQTSLPIASPIRSSLKSMSVLPDVQPEIFTEFNFRIARAIRPKPTTYRVLQECVDIDGGAPGLAAILARNPLIENQFKTRMSKRQIKGDTPTVARGIAMLGLRETRNLVCAIQLLRSVGSKDLSADPREVLAYAVKAEDHLLQLGLKEYDIAFTAGLVFDSILQVGMTSFGAEKEFKDSVARAFNHGLRTARIALELSHEVRSDRISRFIFGTALIHDVGKLAMELLYSEGGKYARFNQEMEWTTPPRIARHLEERRRFGLTHEYYSAAMASQFEVFQEAERAILFHHDPYVIRSTDRELHRFASLIALASNIATKFRIPKNTVDPIYGDWFTSELKGFSLDKQAVLVTMNKIGNLVF